MTDLTELEQELPAQLQRLSGHVGIGGLSRSGIERRVAERAHQRRIRRGIGSGALAVAMSVAVGVGAISSGGDGDRRVVTGDRNIAPASGVPTGDGVSPGPTVASAPEPTTSLPGRGVTDGATCSPAGDNGISNTGSPLVCTAIAGGNELRWRPMVSPGPKVITFGNITFYAPTTWDIQIGGNGNAAVIGRLAGGLGDVNLMVITNFTDSIDTLVPTECNEYPVERPSSVKVTESGFRPVGDRSAEFRLWTSTCPTRGLEVHRAWVLPTSRIAIYEQVAEGHPENVSVVTTAEVR
jgi:hypothetical protein